LHVVRERPYAGEATRGFFHGSIIIDFIGQRGPTWKLHLIVLDILIAGIQLLGLAVLLRREVSDDNLNTNDQLEGGRQGVDVATRQDLDSEEQGFLRSGGHQGIHDNIELQPLRRSVEDGDRHYHEENDNDDDNDGEAEPLNHEQRDPPPRPHPMDVYYSGQVVVADFCLLQTIKEQYMEFRNTVHSSAA